MIVYHVYLNRDGAEKWFAIALYSTEQVNLLGGVFPEITRIETWLGDVVYKRKAKKVVH
jgi:hypothetical protein